MAILQGCATAGRPIDQAGLSKIQRGVTTQAEVVQLMGEPNAISRDGYGNTYLVYLYSHSQVKPSTLIPVVGALAGGAKAKAQSATIAIGPDDKVTNIMSSASNQDVNTGLLAQ